MGHEQDRSGEPVEHVAQRSPPFGVHRSVDFIEQQDRRIAH
jgi:hypothetical protein